jgi:hypothetical protein
VVGLLVSFFGLRYFRISVQNLIALDSSAIFTQLKRLLFNESYEGFLLFMALVIGTVDLLGSFLVKVIPKDEDKSTSNNSGGLLSLRFLMICRTHRNRTGRSVHLRTSAYEALNILADNCCIFYW